MVLFPAELIATNRPPTELEREKALNALRVAKERLSMLEEETEFHPQRNSRLHKRIAVCKLVLSPFRPLPLDIIHEIFSACVYLNHNDPDVLSCQQAPLLLTHISSDLRHIAHAAPELWTRISAIIMMPKRYFPEDIPKHIRSHHRLINHWIQRSGGLPLSLSLTEHTPASDEKRVAEAFDEILDILLDCCYRWHDVSFNLNSFSYSRIAALTDTDVPLLSSIEIVAQSRAKSSRFLDSTIFRAPNLRKFSLPMPSTDVIAKMPVKWAKLSHLNLSIEDPVRIIAEVLRSSKNLLFCHIMTRVTHPADTTYFGDIHLPFLRTLKMTRITRKPCPNAIIQSITAPLLEILFITEDALPTDMKAFLTRSPVIREITLIHPPTTFENVMEWLEYCPSLKALRFESADYLLSELPRCTAYTRLGDRFLCAFVLDNEQHRLCPALEIFWDEDGMAVSLETLQRFFARKDRRLGAPGLQLWTRVKLTVALIPGSEESRSAVDRLVSAQAAAGVEVDLLVLPPPVVTLATASLTTRAHKRSSKRA